MLLLIKLLQGVAPSRQVRSETEVVCTAILGAKKKKRETKQGSQPKASVINPFHVGADLFPFLKESDCIS